MQLGIHPFRWWRRLAVIACFVVFAGFSGARAAELEKAQTLFLKGDYAECLKLVEPMVRQDRGGEDWRILLLKSYLSTGQYKEAYRAATNALDRNYSSIRLRLEAYEVFRQNGAADQAKSVLEQISNLISSRRSIRDAQDLVALGRAALIAGNDPKVILENCFDRARETDPNCREAYIAAGDLALSKHDGALAAKTFQEALAKFEKDPDMLYGLASAFAEDDRAKMGEYVSAALEENPNLAGCHLLLVDYYIDGEQYSDAEKRIDTVLKINPAHPEAWAYRAVIAHLNNDAAGEKTARAEALKYWPENPLVDHLIGRKLSQKYRFTEGAEHQEQALKFDPEYLPAKAQLAQDLLRLGREEEGWKLVKAVYDKDAYDVTAYNLTTLQESMDKFYTLTNAHFTVRMAAREAQLYGRRALALLEYARTNLCPKYGWEPTERITVEIFPEQKDFGVRTFGMPDNPGYLGVCFGPVITANSPASQAASPASWHAVLYHEFCHVVTLHLTKNKMPRWLSEGISVFEETQANPAWGQTMIPPYRERILGKGLKPVSEMSAAFLTAKSGLDLQFAYYQSSLVVEFLVGKYGHDNLKKILADLGEGVAINTAIANHTAPMEQVEKEFAAFARDRAQKMGPELDWEKPPDDDPADIDLAWMAQHPRNFYLLSRRCADLITAQKWEEAKAPLKKLIELYPGNVTGDNPYALLARAYRGLNETNDERAALLEWTKRDADALPAFERLMELEAAATNWAGVLKYADDYLAVNPLTPLPYRYLAKASEAMNQPVTAIDAYRTQLLLDPPDPAEVHFRLGRLLAQAGDASARRHILQALEEAPRFREAHKLLLQLGPSPTPAKAVDEKPKEPNIIF